MRPAVGLDGKRRSNVASPTNFAQFCYWSTIRPNQGRPEAGAKIDDFVPEPVIPDSLSAPLSKKALEFAVNRPDREDNSYFGLPAGMPSSSCPAWKSDRFSGRTFLYALRTQRVETQHDGAGPRERRTQVRVGRDSVLRALTNPSEPAESHGRPGPSALDRSQPPGQPTVTVPL